MSDESIGVSAFSPSASYRVQSWARGYHLFSEHPFRNALRYFRYMARRLQPGRLVHFDDASGNRYISVKNNFTTFAVAVLGERDPNVMRFLRRWLRPGDVAVDVGANVGTYTVVFANLVGPGGRVYSFEPNRSVRACLRQNVRRNACGNVSVIPSAVGAKSASGVLVHTSNNFGEVHLAPSPSVRAAGVAVTSITTLDREILNLGHRPIRYLKIDVEGYEYDVLEGARHLIETSRELVVQTEIVPAHLARYGRSIEDLLRWMKARGYQPYRCSNAGHLLPIGSDPAGDLDWFWARPETLGD